VAPGVRDTFPPLYAAAGGLAFASILVGAAASALGVATDAYLERREGTGAGTDEADALAIFGRLSARVQSAIALREQVAAEISSGFERREISVPEIVELIQRSEITRLYAAGVGLEVGSEVFEIPGLGAILDEAGIDRCWRDVRIHSLHVNPRIYHSIRRADRDAGRSVADT
jgi:alkylation response protein AidB-like acyl-CoA dehydrogenase